MYRIDVQIWIKLTRPVMMIVFIRLFVVILLNQLIVKGSQAICEKVSILNNENCFNIFRLK